MDAPMDAPMAAPVHIFIFKRKKQPRPMIAHKLAVVCLAKDFFSPR